jgi:hypothetical protein
MVIINDWHDKLINNNYQYLITILCQTIYIKIPIGQKASVATSINVEEFQLYFNYKHS